jgi:hypothetical protein
LLAVEGLEQRLAPAAVTVTNPFDEFDAYTGSPPVPPVGVDGLLSLREAIVLLNSSGGGTLSFAVPKAFVSLGPLPAFTAPVTIDVPLIDGHPSVEISGGGLHLLAPYSTVKGLAINGSLFGPGLALDAGGMDDIENNFIGTDPTGHVAEGNELGLYVGPLAPGNVVKNNLVSGNLLDGIELLSTGNHVLHNLLGTDITGMLALPNRVGVSVHNAGNVIGGDRATDGNVISGNTAEGVCITDPPAIGNLVEGNFIGTTAPPPGTTSDGVHVTALPNDLGVGIFNGASANLVGGTTAATRNIISGNHGTGVLITGHGTDRNVVHGNFIGTDVDDTHPLGNGGTGVVIQAGAQANRVGSAGTVVGDTSERNVISNNGGDGVAIHGAGTDANIVAGNALGSDWRGLVTYEGNHGRGVAIYDGAKKNQIGVNGSPTAPATQRNVIADNSGDGVAIYGVGTDENVVAGNAIGTDLGLGPITTTSGGAYREPNGGRGVAIYNGAQKNRVGTDGTGTHLADTANFIEFNVRDGVWLSGTGTSANVIGGNLIGAGPLNQSEGNGGSGVLIDNGAASNTIGGTTAGTGNVISGNRTDGVLIRQAADPADGNRIDAAPIPPGAGVNLAGLPAALTTLNVVAGNLIGTNRDGTAPLPNTNYGVEIAGAAANTIGGTSGSAANLISGNLLGGVLIWSAPGPASATANVVAANRIGTTRTGTAAIPNWGSAPANGVTLTNAASTIIGGTAAGAWNVIAGNTGDGVRVDGGTANRVQGNFIGTRPDGTTRLGNGLAGVFLTGGTTNNTVGVTIDAAGADNGLGGNTIAFNDGSGVVVASGTGNAIRRNAIYSNGLGLSGGIGIDLGNDGVTLNHPAPVAGAANLLQAFPVLTGADVDPATHAFTVVSGRLHSKPLTTFRVEFFSSPVGDRSWYGQGETFIGSTMVRTNGNGDAPFAARVQNGAFITATATDDVGNTSEFSSYVRVTSLAAALPSTANAVTGARPPADLYVTTNSSLDFTANDADYLVALKDSGTITVAALGLNVPNAPLRWQIDRNAADTVGAAGATPALSSQVGRAITVTPDVAGSFRLICYLDANGNRHFEAGEELVVMRLAIVQTKILPGATISTAVAFHSSLPGGGQVGVATTGAMALRAQVLLEGGGADQRLGVNRVRLGDVGNLVGDTFVVNYPGRPAPADGRGATETEDPDFDANPAAGFPSPMIDKAGIPAGTAPTGGDTAFRGHSDDGAVNPRVNGAGGLGQLVTVTSSDAPTVSWDRNHPTTHNRWATTAGDNAFREFVVGYSTTFPRNYLALAEGEWTVTFAGTNPGGAAHHWTQGAHAGVTLQGLTFVAGGGAATRPLTVGRFPLAGDGAGVQVLGLSFVNEYGMIVSLAAAPPAHHAGGKDSPPPSGLAAGAFVLPANTVSVPPFDAVPFVDTVTSDWAPVPTGEGTTVLFVGAGYRYRKLWPVPGGDEPAGRVQWEWSASRSELQDVL